MGVVRFDVATAWRTMHEKGWWLVGEEASTRGTEVNTGVCIVCGERAGSVAILRIAPCRFCFRSRCPDRFLPSHMPPHASTHYAPFVSPASSLSRISPSLQKRRGEERRGEERLVSLSLSADKGNWCALVSRATPFLHSDCLLAARRLSLDGEISV